MFQCMGILHVCFCVYKKVGLNKPQGSRDCRLRGGLDIIRWRHSAFQTWGWRRGELFVQDYFQHSKTMTLKSQIVFWARTQYFLIKRSDVKPYRQTGKAMASHLSDLPILYKYYTTAKYHVQFYYYIFPYITILKCTWKTTITGNIHIKDMKKRVGRYWLRGPFVCVWVCVLVYMYILCVYVFVCLSAWHA